MMGAGKDVSNIEDEVQFVDEGDDLLFADEDQGDDGEGEGPAPWTVMIVDDEPEVHTVTEMALSDVKFDGRKLNFLHAYSGAEAKALIHDHPGTALILLDVVMEEDDAGLGFAKYVRDELQAPLVRIILRTGQPGMAPEERVIVEYDINDYKSKTELTTAKLFSAVVLALRGFRDLRTLQDTKRKAEEILIELKNKEVEAARAMAEKEAAEARAALVEELERVNERMRSDLEAASEIQRALLPTRSPITAGATFAWHLEPCDELAGDTLDIIQLDDTHIAMYVADVSGHGVPAALLAVTLNRFLSLAPVSVIRETIDEPPGYRITTPSDVASRLDRQFADAAESGRYFTLAYAILDVKTRTLRLIAASHPPPVLLSHGGPKAIDVSGFPVGFLVEPCEERVVQLRPGDRFFFYSDGVLEVRGPSGQTFGPERVMQTLEAARSRSLEDSVKGLLDALDTWRGRMAVEDDVSVLALEIPPEG